MKKLIYVAISIFFIACNANDGNNNNEKGKVVEVKNELLVKEIIEDKPENIDLGKDEYLLENDKFIIKIVQLDDKSLFYSSWSKPKSLDDEPDLFLKNGTSKISKNGDTLVDFIKNLFVYNVTFSNADETSLNVFKNDKVLLTKVLNSYTEKNINGYLLKKAILYASSHWDTLKREADFDIVQVYDWAQDIGVRGKYQILKSELGITFLEKVLNEKAFLVGPHEGDNMNYFSDYNYGQYNPKFLKALYNQLSDFYADTNFVHQTQEFYNKRFKNYLRSYYFTYSLAANNGIYKLGNKIDQNTIYSFSSSKSSEGYEMIELYTTFDFWYRRSYDKTANEFFRLLTLMLETYDKEFIMKNRVEEIPLIESLEVDYIEMEEMGC